MLKINQELHNEGHMGRDKTLKLLVDKFHWPSMQKEVEKFVGGEGGGGLSDFRKVSNGTTINVKLP